jgi:NADPH-dependent curcumin reductase CurA
MPPEDQKQIEFLQKFERLILTSENNAKNLDELKNAFQCFKALLYPKLEERGLIIKQLQDDVLHIDEKLADHIADHKIDTQREMSVWMLRVSGAAAIISLLGVIGLYLK